MAAYRFTVNGVSLLNYLAEDGIKWTRFDVEAPDTGRTLDGVMHRGRVASKVRLDITCRPLKSSEAMAVLGEIVQQADAVDGKTISCDKALTSFSGAECTVTCTRRNSLTRDKYIYIMASETPERG